MALALICYNQIISMNSKRRTLGGFGGVIFIHEPQEFLPTSPGDTEDPVPEGWGRMGYQRY